MSVSPGRGGVRRTLRGRVSLLGVVVIGAWVVLVTIVFNLVLSQRLHHQADVVLRARAVTAAATVVVDGSDVNVRENSGDGQLDSGIWIYANGRTISRPSGGDASLDGLTKELAAGQRGYVTRGTDRYYTRSVHRDGRTVATVVASLSDVPYDHARDEALVGSSTVAALMVLGSYPVLRFAAGRALRPVTEMTRRAKEWSAQGLDERFGADQPYREVQDLASTLDSVLDTLAAIVRHERQLPAELSHELRTPLSRIIAESDLLIARPRAGEALAAAQSAIRDSAMAMETILETLLTAAREDVRTAPGRCELAPVLHTLATRDVPSGAPAITVRADPGLAVGVDAPVVERILAPVLDNALRYARTRIDIVAARESGAVVIDVVDDGPGVQDGLREEIFEPGHRASPDDGHDGAGLGLALARRLARAASGDVEVVGPDSRFRLRLPAA